MYSESFGSDEPAENTALSTQVHVEGQLEAGDLDIPRINIAQKMSGEVPGRPGQISINKEFVLYEPEVKIPVNILSAVKAWKEDLPFDSPDKPRFARTLEESRAIEADSEHGVIHFAEFVLLIARTPDCLLTDDEAESAFPYIVGDFQFALGKLTAQKRGYDSTFKRVATFGVTNKNVDLANVIWNFSSVGASSGKYSWHVPSLAATRGQVSPEVAEFIKSLKGGAQ